MLDKEDVLKLYPNYDKVYGPYLCQDGRKRVVLRKSGSEKNQKTTVSYPKLIKELELGRRLSSVETVDHNDRDKTNDALENLKVLDKSTHSSLDAMRVSVAPMTCPICESVFAPNVNQRNVANKAGPFCSKVCAGKYGASVQNGAEKIDRAPIIKTYYRAIK